MPKHHKPNSISFNAGGWLSLAVVLAIILAVHFLIPPHVTNRVGPCDDHCKCCRCQETGMKCQACER